MIAEAKSIALPWWIVLIIAGLVFGVLAWHRWVAWRITEWRHRNDAGLRRDVYGRTR